MRVKWLLGILVGFIMFFFTALANASLSHIGFAFYDDGSEYVGAYRLIYDDDLQLTWLDCMKVRTNYWGSSWLAASDWASSLNDGWPLFHESLFPDITMNWTGDWDLPTINELSHLYEVEGVDPLNTGPFLNYPNGEGLWSNSVMFGGAYAAAWDWWTYSPIGKSWAPHIENVSTFFDQYDALAVRHGLIGAPVPIPTTIFLFSSGLAYLSIIRRNRTRKI